jgi:hypothetical protein
VVVVARKVAVLALSVFLSKEELQTQSALVITVLFAAGLLHCRYWPFVEDELNYAELASICRCEIHTQSRHTHTLAQHTDTHT